MIRKASLSLLCLIVILILLPQSAEAQFMRLQFTIEEEFVVSNLEYISPGELYPGYGRVNIPVNDIGTGRFTISAGENTELLVSVIASEKLVKDPDNSIPFEVETYYINDGTGNVQTAVAFENNTAVFPVNNSGLLVDRMDGRMHKLEANIIIASSYYIGNIDPGTYYGNITVRIEI